LARKILLADDSVTAQNLGRKILADAGYEVIIVNNGSAALKKISEQRPDLIVLDVYMPGYSGLEVCQRLKDVPDTSRIPILLTVGKLEPFKPEEARRARADGFIIKPFEASELLSALSKLEDKVVPWGETSKTVAGATAATEDSRFDKSRAAENDSRWKTRIGFPKKNSKPAEEADDPAAYAPVHKDARLQNEGRDAEEPKLVERASASRSAEEERVVLGALAPPGYEDVTAEEIAALASAAAQINGKLAEDKASELVAEMPVVVPAEVQASRASTGSATGVSDSASAAPEKAAVEEKEKEAEDLATAAQTPGVASAETEAGPSQAANSGSGRWSPGVHAKADEPVTMASAARAANSGVAGARWTAVAVALAPEDTGISLEQEMQRMYLGYPAEADRTAIFRIPEMPTPPAVMAPADLAPAAPAVRTAAEAPEAEATMSVVASAGTKAIGAAVVELESVAAVYAAERAALSAPATTPEVSQAPGAAMPVPETPESTVPQAEAGAKTQGEAIKLSGLKNFFARLGLDFWYRSKSKRTKGKETAKIEVPKAGSEEPAKAESKQEESKDVAPVEARAAETPATAAAEDRKQETVASEISEEPATAVHEASLGVFDDMARRESETAAWASGRKIRETGTAKPLARDSAMAVAAGEHIVEDEESLANDPEISSIVDSVLADMRPRIVEEIARKLGKKK